MSGAKSIHHGIWRNACWKFLSKLSRSNLLSQNNHGKHPPPPRHGANAKQHQSSQAVGLSSDLLQEGLGALGAALVQPDEIT